MFNNITDTHPQTEGLYHPQFEHDSCGVGFIANIKGKRTHEIVHEAAIMLTRMEHRGACGSEPNTGDGAGILTSLPYEIFSRDLKIEDILLPEPGDYAVGMVFLPTDEALRTECEQTLEAMISEKGQKLLGWRDVPIDPDGADIGPTARRAMPVIRQVFIAKQEGLQQVEFERELFKIRKITSHRLRHARSNGQLFYICSLSSKIIIYKGMLSTGQLVPFYKDLGDATYKSRLAMVHSRFSTNTFPSWDRAQPLRCMAHNGEINTLKGNANWVFARQGLMETPVLGDMQELFPIIEPNCSDSGSFDNALELLLMAGRSLPESVMMMVPEAWQNHATMPEDKRGFYEFHSAIQEPWDGPASISFTDGKYIGAVLDRNGLRPSRYYVTKLDHVIMASEVGVVDIPPEDIVEKGRLQPGKMFLVDFEEGRIISDDELKTMVSTQRPYRRWIEEQRIQLNDLEPAQKPDPFSSKELVARMKASGFNIETMQFMLIPMINVKKDPISSMGNDAALACLSDKPSLTYDYFKQLFAQVTNPAIDSIREEIIMSLECFVGPEQNILKTSAQQGHRLLIQHPILTDEELAAIKSMNHRGWTTRTIDITFDKSEGESGLRNALDRICGEAEQAIADGQSLIVLSDRAVDENRVATSALLATGAVHHHLVKKELRTQIGIIVEAGEAREVHHHCLLIGYGADAINPYLTYAALKQAREDGTISSNEWTDEKIVAAYRKGVAKGMLKVLAKMGISTLQSYKGAQIFEAVGLNEDVIDRCFVGTPSRIKGVGFDVLFEESRRRHETGFGSSDADSLQSLDNFGQIHWRKDGEKHAWSPFTIAEIQNAARNGDKNAYARFSKLVNEEVTRQCHLRGLLEFKTDRHSVPLDEVEPATEILKRFCTGAMSYGSISAEAHETLAVAMNRIGGKSNTGEGGEDYARFQPLETGDSKRSAIKQIASGRFGVTAYYLTNADELQIKIAQGAKPGEGGELPGHKVNDIIAATRHSTPGVGLISPPPHHDIYSIEDLAQLIFDLKCANPSARISVKLVSEVGVGTIAAGVAKGHADNILISGTDGGTGASPLTSIKHAGLPWELGLAETHQTLVKNNLRSRVRIQTDGQLKTGRDIVIATLLGAEEYGLSTAPLITMGCIMMRKCHLNTCPVGIATQDPELRKKFTGKPEHVVNYLFMVAEETRQIMAQIGFRTIDEMVGRTDVLEASDALNHWKAKSIDLTPVLTLAKPNEGNEVFCTKLQDHGIDRNLDNQLIADCQEAIENQTPVQLGYIIRNTDRAVGTTLSHEISKKHGAEGLPRDTITIKFAGSAGQSLGAWLAAGVTLEVEGDANDYVGKGLSGGTIIVSPPKMSGFKPHKNIVIGNVALYGAVKGEAFFRGIAAERFCVRNSGAKAVVEGVGDHACEYMTGGTCVILGSTGRNFAAGMSGGVAYVLDAENKLLENCNLETVELEPLEDDDKAELHRLVSKHFEKTKSDIAKELLKNWEESLSQFKKVMPVDYKRALLEMKAKQTNASSESASNQSANQNA